MKKFFGKKSRNALTLVLIVSFGLHVVALVVFGMITFVNQTFREEKTFEAEVIETPDQLEPEYTVNLEQRNQESSPPPPRPIVVSQAVDVVIPKLDIDVDLPSSGAYGRGRGGSGFGSGGGRTQEIRDMVIKAELFGQMVEATKLGVVLDISRSTHDIIDKVIKEIQDNFEDALIVFTPGCGFGGEDIEVVPLSQFEQMSKKYPLVENARKNYTPLAFAQRLLNNNSAFERIWKTAERKDLGYIVFGKVNVSKSTDKNGEEDITAGSGSGCDNAFEFLSEQGVDTIYWFADFKDNLDSGLGSKVGARLRQNKTKLIIHDFIPPMGKSGENDPRAKVMQDLADRTGGSVFVKEI